MDECIPLSNLKSTVRCIQYMHYLIIIRIITIEFIAVYQKCLPRRYVLNIDLFDIKFEK